MIHKIRAKTIRGFLALSLLATLPRCGPRPEGKGEAPVDLLEQLRATRPRARIDAARELGKQRSTEAVDPLIRLLYDTREDVRLAAIEALGEIGSDRATRQLTPMLTAAGWRVRQAAARALGRIGDPVATDALLLCLDDERRAVAYAAALAVGPLGLRARAGLVGRLSHTNAVVRECAVLGLGRGGDPGIAEYLHPLLQDPEPLVRLSAAGALGKIGDTNSIDGIVALLADHQIGDPGAVCRALTGMGEAAMPALQRALGHRDRNVRRTVVGVLGRIQSPAVVPPLLVAAADRDRHVHGPALALLERRLAEPGAAQTVLAGLRHPEVTVRRKALDLLDETAHPKVFDAAVDRLGDAAPEMRLRAVQLLGKLKKNEAVGPLSKLTEDKDLHVRLAAANVLVDLGDGRGADVLLDGLKLGLAGQKRCPLQRGELEAAIRSLGRLRNEHAVDPLVELLTHPDDGVVAAAADSLGLIGDKRVYEPLLACFRRMMTSGDWRKGKRVGVVMSALGRLRDPRAVDVLLPYLKNKSHESAAATALGFTGDKRVIEPIAEAARKIWWSGPRGRYFHMACAYALERIDREKIIPIIVELLEKEPPENVVTIQAYCQIFGRSEHPQAVEALVKLMRADLPEVRQAARAGIIAMGETGVVELIRQLRDAKSGHRSFISVALAEIGEPAVPHLEKALADESPKVRQGAVWAFGQSGKTAALPKLTAMVDDEHGHVRGAVAWALGELRDPAGTAALIELLGDADANVRAGAAASLGRTGGGDALAALKQAQKDTDPDVREAVSSALGRLALKREQ